MAEATSGWSGDGDVSGAKAWRTSQHDACDSGCGQQEQELIRAACHACRQDGAAQAQRGQGCWVRKASIARLATSKEGLALQVAARHRPVGAVWFADSMATEAWLLLVVAGEQAISTSCTLKSILPTARGPASQAGVNFRWLPTWMHTAAAWQAHACMGGQLPERQRARRGKMHASLRTRGTTGRAVKHSQAQQCLL